MIDPKDDSECDSWDKILQKINLWTPSENCQQMLNIYKLCAEFLSKYEPIKSWHCYLDWYGRMLVSKHNNLWATNVGQKTMVISRHNVNDGEDYIECNVLEYFNKELETVRITENNYKCELQRLIMLIS